MQESKKFAFDVSITFIALVVNTLIGFIILMLLGRYLGAGDLGLYRMTATIYSFTILIGALGIPTAMIKYVAEFKEDRTNFNQNVSSGVITSLFLGIGFSMFFYFTSWVFAEIFDMPGLLALLKILAPIYPFAFVGGALLALLNGLREMKKHAQATIIQSVLMMIFTVILVSCGFGISGAIIGMFLSSIGSCAFLIWICRKYFDFTLDRYRQMTKKLIGFGAQISVASAINEINNQMDILLVGFFLTAVDVGYYTVAVGLGNFFWLIPMSIQKITFPATTEYWVKDKRLLLNKMIDKSMKFTLSILILIGLGVGFFAKDIIVTLFKEDFIYAVFPLQILLIGTVIRGGIAQSIGGSLIGIGRPDLSFKISALMMTINIILDVVLIPKIGIVGAAIATTISLSGGAFINLGLVVKYLSIKVDFRWYLRIFGVTAIAILLFRFGIVFLNPFLLGGMILIGYSILIFQLFLTKEDKDIFKSLALGYRRRF